MSLFVRPSPGFWFLLVGSFFGSFSGLNEIHGGLQKNVAKCRIILERFLKKNCQLI